MGAAEADRLAELALRGANKIARVPITPQLLTMSKYTQVYEGKWVRPRMSSYRMCCCDCGLVHKMEFRVRNHKMELRAWRDKRATGQVRRHLEARAVRVVNHTIVGS